MPKQITRSFSKCEDCGFWIESCMCGQPKCESCINYATTKVKYEDDIYWFCDDCEYEGQEV
jgi:hypothetical protein